MELVALLLGAFYTVGIPAMVIALLVKTSRIRDDIGEVKSLLRNPGRVAKEERKSETVASAPAVKRADAPASLPPAPSPVECPPSAMDLFWEKVENWLAVKGEFAPEGVTHEFAFATRWLVMLGVLLVAASIVYFVKLSIDRGWMGPAGRVAATVLWGAVASAGGAYIVKRTRYGIVGHAVAALGIVALYVGFGLGHRWFDPPVISSAPLAFAALFCVTLSAGFASVFIPSSFISAVAVVGGYAVPVVAGRDTGSPVGLCAYLLLIDAMAFFVARFRRWSALDFLSATLAYATLFVWCGRHGALTVAQSIVVLACFTAVHAVYMLGVVVESGRRGGAGNAIAWAGLVLNACAYLAYLSTHFRSGFSSELAGLVLLALVAAYLSVAVWARRSGRTDSVTVGIVLSFAIVFLSVAPLLIFGGLWWTFAWSAMAVAASEAGARLRERLLERLGIAVFAVAALYGIFRLAPLCYGLAIGRDGYLGFASLEEASAGYWGALFLRIARLWTLPVAAAAIGRRERGGMLFWIACVIGFLLCTLEARVFGAAFLPSLKGGSITLAWFLVAFAGVWFGIVRRARTLRIWSLSILGVSFVKLLAIDTSHLDTPPRVATFALSGVLMIVGAYLYVRFRDRFTQSVPGEVRRAPDGNPTLEGSDE